MVSLSLINKKEYQAKKSLLTISTLSLNMKILVWISWWVDSAVAAYLLKKQWHHIVWGFMLNYLDESNPNCTTKQDLKSFYEVCDFLQIPFEVIDFRDEYENKVLRYLYDGYLSGVTPNPDILCNSEIKFKLFLDEALALWYDMIATGHYAKITTTQTNWTFRLLRGADELKDQSYFLAWLNQYQLSKALFPLGDLTKTEVRAIAHRSGLPNADRKDSQWLCFVGNVPMSKLLQEKIGTKSGDIVSTDGRVLWTHTWAYQYTIGQRKGIGLHVQCYVVDIDIIRNRVVVSTDEQDALLYRTAFHWRNPHRILSEPTMPFRSMCKIRYRQWLQPCTVTKIANWSITVTTDEPQKWVPNGQICVLYGGSNNQEVLWSWEITSEDCIDHD